MKYHFDKSVALRVIMGANHPVRIICYGDSKSCYTVGTLCNGTMESLTKFARKRDALEKAESLVADYAGFVGAE